MNIKSNNQVLRDVIEELKRRYDFIQYTYKNAQVKMFAFVGAGFGLLTYLYSNSADKIEFYFLPKENYGKILFILAISLILSSMIKLFLSIRGTYWEYPLHIIKLTDIEKRYSETGFLDYLRNDYIRAIELNQRTYNSVHKSLNESSLMLVVGGILVLLIKIFS